MNMFLWLSLIPVLFYCIFRHKRRRLYKYASSVIKHKEDLPIIGVTWAFLGFTGDIFVKLQQFSTFTSQNGGLTNCWLGPHLYYTGQD
ncbi:unnamed protein product [Leptidea sinapis]|uniref:Uncharacterized protein n=1 Tax=Leptidea sinapis TaxID=189913 RepID=A0A5E4Q4M1_9NEOP|nr:unnamed protein product [Leptidea sinapis]